MRYLRFSSIFLSLAFTVMLISVTIQWVIYKRKKLCSLPIPPGPKPWPVVGSIPEILRNKPAFRWIHKFMDETNTEIACIRLGRTYVIPVTSPELACEFLKKQDSIFSSRPHCMSAGLISNGYLTSLFLPYGEEWTKKRRILTSHVLSPATQHLVLNKRVEEADHLLRFIYNQCKISEASAMGAVINVRTATRHYCGNVTKKMLFNKRYFGRGTADGGPGAVDEELVKAVFTILRYLYGLGVADYIGWLSVFDLDGHKSMIRKALKVTRKHLDTEVDKRIQMWKDGTKTVEEDIVDVLVMLKDNDGSPMLSDKEIKIQVLEIMIAALDNPSNAVEWALAEMINQPKLLEKAVEEIDNVVGRERLVQESDLPKLNYIKACLKEAFRLHPIAPFTPPHLSTEDSVVGGYFIPKGSQVIISRTGLGRNKRAWEDPLKFKPERHLKGEDVNVVLSDSELKMMSFGAGRRGCPGVKLGSLMSVMLMARLIQGFTWSVPSDLPCIDLTQSEHDLFLENPLFALAKPRLPHNLYM
nr:isoleucine N-monooxygenase 1-like [Ipomoea batatas]GMD39861.1 isoleucine N-monooxygenase 1-like [Ipomoea batatas]GME16113.1 isoleucine N-monooxygenase 1-like [Ipomoea batatas]GME21499.1 isoleucine N-monooxygenase 1-like [Ipomoea batatas]